MSTTEHFVRDSILEDAAQAQKQAGKIPAIADNSRYIEDILQRMDRKESDRPAVNRPTTTKKEGGFEKELARKCRTAGIDVPGDYQVVRDEQPVVKVSKTNSLKKKLKRRIRFLMTMPEWRDKILAVNPYASAGVLGPAKRMEAEKYLRKVWAEADVKFGEWWKEPPAKPLFFHAK